MKYERKKWYDAYGTGNFTEDKSENFTLEISEEKAKKFFEFWEAIGATYFETSKYRCWETKEDARHCTWYMIYK